MKLLNKEFKTLFLRAMGFLLFLVLFDLTIGFFTKKIFFSQETGKYARLTKSIYDDSSEILIMGSSHANRHYIPEVFEEKLNMTCYNAGVQGQRIIFHSALLKMILKNHQPEVVILNIDEPWMYQSTEAYETLADLHPYYWDYKTELDPILSLNSKYPAIKLLSTAYQTNSTLVHAIKYYLQPQEDFKGYRPLFGKVKKPNSAKNTTEVKSESSESRKIDENFVRLFEEFISDAQAQDVELIVVVSPHLYPDETFNHSRSLKIMKSATAENQIPLFDFSNDNTFIEQYHLFNDPGHLNRKGALLFSKIMADTLKNTVVK